MATLNDQDLVAQVTQVVQEAGERMKARFSRDSRLSSRADINTTIGANDAASLEVLRVGLMHLRPDAGWVEDELEGGALPPGEWWVVDPVEGAINLAHGMTDWCVSATLVRDNAPVLTVVHLPLTEETYSAVRGGGAFLDGGPMTVSSKSDLRAALVGTGQARPGEDAVTHRRIGDSVTAMLQRALVVRVSVPATWQLIQLAAGRTDVFWQFSQVRSGLLAGALLVEEAGGVLSDTQGKCWTLSSTDFAAAAPGLHACAVEVLSVIR